MRGGIRSAGIVMVAVVTGCGSATDVAAQPAVRQAATNVVRVLNAACGDPSYGSAFPAGRDFYVTAAHVVAGAHTVQLLAADGTPDEATLVVFDPAHDVAVLRVASSQAALPLAGTAVGASVAIAAYPVTTGREVTDDATVTAITAGAHVTDIYGNPGAIREVMDLNVGVGVGGGESGGPVFDSSGTVVGMIYGYSTTNGPDAYAVTTGQIKSDVDAAGAAGAGAEAGPGHCLAA